MIESTLIFDKEILLGSRKHT